MIKIFVTKIFWLQLGYTFSHTKKSLYYLYLYILVTIVTKNIIFNDYIIVRFINKPNKGINKPNMFTYTFLGCFFTFLGLL